MQPKMKPIPIRWAHERSSPKPRTPPSEEGSACSASSREVPSVPEEPLKEEPPFDRSVPDIPQQNHPARLIREAEARTLLREMGVHTGDSVLQNSPPAGAAPESVPLMRFAAVWARRHLKSLRGEVERLNRVLERLGPAEEGDEEWSSSDAEDALAKKFEALRLGGGRGRAEKDEEEERPSSPSSRSGANESFSAPAEERRSSSSSTGATGRRNEAYAAYFQDVFAASVRPGDADFVAQEQEAGKAKGRRPVGQGEIQGPHAVLDTNQLLADQAALDHLLRLGRTTFVIPQRVLVELDGLAKASSSTSYSSSHADARLDQREERLDRDEGPGTSEEDPRQIRGSSAGDPSQLALRQKQARDAKRYLESSSSNFRQNKLVFQSADQDDRSLDDIHQGRSLTAQRRGWKGGNNFRSNNDDRILGCAVHFFQATGGDCVLLSDDRVLKLKAKAFEVPCMLVSQLLTRDLALASPVEMARVMTVEELARRNERYNGKKGKGKNFEKRKK